MKTAIVILLAAALAPAGEAVKYVVIFDFQCKDSPKLGRQLADSVRLRLRRHKGYDVLDKLTTAEMTPAGGVGPETAEAKVAALLKDKFAAQVAVTGRLEKMGEGFRAEVRCVDISTGKPVAWTKVFSDRTERARGLIANGIVEAIRGSGEWKPPEYGDEAEPKIFGRALNVGGGFESSAGWQRPDNVSMRIVPDRRAGRSGEVLRIFTDLDREAWLAYQRDLRLGKADPSRPPKIGTVANKYATVAGLEGVQLSPPPPAQPVTGLDVRLPAGFEAAAVLDDLRTGNPSIWASGSGNTLHFAMYNVVDGDEAVIAARLREVLAQG